MQVSPGKDGSKLETAAMLSQLKTQPSLVTLEWILELIKTEVLRYVTYMSPICNILLNKCGIFAVGLG